jgi:hypothetical protein
MDFREIGCEYVEMDLTGSEQGQMVSFLDNGDEPLCFMTIKNFSIK